ncbi:hypothetical protein MTP03_13310 [Tsukamurella sp. PLM1]|nr:hypothetical protein MTP03_13310 [Tsukamurella sp. PLM1]
MASADWALTPRCVVTDIIVSSRPADEGRTEPVQTKRNRSIDPANPPINGPGVSRSPELGHR